MAKVEALDRARTVFYPSLQPMPLGDLKARAVIKSAGGKNVWSAMGVSRNVIRACFAALGDLVEYYWTFLQEVSFTGLQILQNVLGGPARNRKGGSLDE